MNYRLATDWLRQCRARYEIRASSCLGGDYTAVELAIGAPNIDRGHAAGRGHISNGVYGQSAPYVIDDVLKDTAIGSICSPVLACIRRILLVGSVAQSLAAPLAILFVQKQSARLVRLILKSIAVALSVSLPGLAIAILFGKQLLSLVFTPAYGADNDVFVILMIAGAADGVGNVLGTTASSMRVLHCKRQFI